MKRPSRPTPHPRAIPRGGRATTTPQWRTVAEVSRVTGHSRHAIYSFIKKGRIVGRQMPGFLRVRSGVVCGVTRREWLIDWNHAQKHLPPYRVSSSKKGQKEPISPRTWRRFLVVWGKFLRGECEPAPAGHPVRRR